MNLIGYVRVSTEEQGRKGFSLAPTIYSIPLAFAGAVVLWTSSMVMLVWHLIFS